ncbi:MAG: BrnA antitoxin family protein [Methylacidiphilales bacterium]|nr:BrnA antitoxin family protein [Candidatus Methylacidiphilales bacterium]MDW8349267.1 CopG family antitoxin [Verrucomicrobiae bacterium]
MVKDLQSEGSGYFEGVSSQDKREIKTLYSWDEVPYFISTQEEVEYWRSHGLSESLMRGSLITGDAGESTMITLRMHPRMLARLKRLARMRYLNYQSMIKQWIAERLEEEDSR